MRKLAVIFIWLVVLANSFNLSYIVITTIFYNENIVKDQIARELHGPEQNRILNLESNQKIEAMNLDFGVNLVKMDEVNRVRFLNSSQKLYYEMSVLNGGKIVKCPIKVFVDGEEYIYTIYVNPFLKKIAGVSP